MTNLFTNKYFIIFLFLLSFLFLILNFVDYNINEDKSTFSKNERFDSSLIRLNTLAKLENYIDSLANIEKIQIGTIEYTYVAKEVISLRFFHKYATQRLNENWIASVSQNVTGKYLSSKITADDILTRAYGYCGQQNAVFMELLQKKNIDCRAVYFKAHFALQAKINNRWTYFDPNQEPNISLSQRIDEKWLTSYDSLFLAYKMERSAMENAFGNPVSIKFGAINEIQGQNAQIFQSITKWLSKIAFLFPLLLYFYLNRKNNLRIAANYQKQTT